MKRGQLGMTLGTVLLLLGAGCGEHEAAGSTLRVMSWNIHHATGTDGVFDLERVADVIAAAQPDLVALQEVDRGVARTDRRLLDDELAAALGMELVFGKTTVWQGGDFGNSVLSRLPVESSRNDLLRLVDGDEQRGVLQVDVRVEDTRVTLLNTHMADRGGGAEQLRNVEDLHAILEHYPADPFLLVGDFNAPPESATVAAIQADLTDAWRLAGRGDGRTMPADAPNTRIDYVFLPRWRQLYPRDAWVIDTIASDHRPVVVDLVIPRR